MCTLLYSICILDFLLVKWKNIQICILLHRCFYSQKVSFGSGSIRRNSSKWSVTVRSQDVHLTFALERVLLNDQLRTKRMHCSYAQCVRIDVKSHSDLPFGCFACLPSVTSMLLDRRHYFLGKVKMQWCRTDFTRAQSCDVTRVQNPAEWSASVHTLHLPRAVM